MLKDVERYFQGNSADIMNICADMVLADAIEDLAEQESITKAEARDRLLSSNAYNCLYDFDSKLWAEGSDYFLSFYRNSLKNKTRQN
ncbi:MAG: hypothetical protein K6E47_14620 [Lachnospiraceae bacterium]|nr:hypothetical protein [Lachnospiraceae bacterium]